jgi:hypothetical protein
MYPLRRGQRIRVLIAPWAFVALFAVVWVGILVPRALGGQAALICISVLAGLALLSFVIAAVSFSRDVLAGRWPDDHAEV